MAKTEKKQSLPKSAKTGAQDIAEQLGLKPGQSVELLKALHILTREGKLNQDSRRKLKQVYHLYQFIEPLLKELSQDGHAVTLADHGAGKSYLGFILYDLYFKALGQGRIYGIETRAPLVEASQKLAAELGFERMEFLNMSVAESTRADFMPEQFDVVTACTPAIRRRTMRSPLDWKNRPGPWCSCLAARRKWQHACASPRP